MKTLLRAMELCRKKNFNDSSQAFSMRKYLELDEDQWPVILDNGRLYVFHLGVESDKQLLRHLPKRILLTWIRLNQIIFTSRFHLVVRRSPMAGGKRTANLELLINSEVEWFENKLCRPLANKKLPTI